MKYANAYLCYSPQNFVKALRLAHAAHARGERSKILAWIGPELADAPFFDGRGVSWADVEVRRHPHRYVRLLDRDRARPLVLAGKLARKAWSRARRVLATTETRALLAALADAEDVHLFLETTWYSDAVLRERRCTLVEEGVASYLPVRGLARADGSPRYPGEHPNVRRVLLQRPDAAPPSVRAKVEPLELDYAALPADARRELLALFGMEHFAARGRAAIVVGQAWSCSSVEPDSVRGAHARIVAELGRRGFAVHVKPHPNEDADAYRALGAELLDPRLPLEVFELLERPHPFECAVSLLSSSLANAPRLARRVYRPEDGALVVEDVTPERFDELARGTLAALARSD
ncbi:MAG: polysialyltransferase family glycosyltransferase [Planctomycetota bacterium]